MRALLVYHMNTSSSSSDARAHLGYEHDRAAAAGGANHVFIGTMATIALSLLSALSAIYMEAVIKRVPVCGVHCFPPTASSKTSSSSTLTTSSSSSLSSTSKHESSAVNMMEWGKVGQLFVTNIQLSVFGLVFGGFSIGFDASTFPSIEKFGFFQGWTALATIIVALQAIGGILVASVTLYLDSVTKTLTATSSIVVTTAVAAFVFHDLVLNAQFVAAALIVISAVFLYVNNFSPASPTTSNSTSTSTTKHVTNHDHVKMQIRPSSSASEDENHRL